ncbi:MAG: VCBS repeat-containing protein, partial [Planctomycetota bacterium]|nr:VCBS repeat-containing protein [Planctomycetota bacterium]
MADIFNSFRPRTGKVRAALLIACCGGALLVALALGGRRYFQSNERSKILGDRLTAPTERSPGNLENIEARTTAFCGDCHRTPRADYFARARWHNEVERGYRFFDASLRTDLSPPPLAEIVAYYRRNAPEDLVIKRPNDDSPGHLRFRKLPVARDPGSPASAPAISFLKSIVTEAGEPPLLFACDMYSGELLTIDMRTEGPIAKRLAQVGHPAHVEPCDLDADGAIDLVVADLGSFLPEDHDRGRVVWLRNTGRSEGSGRSAGYEQIVLLDGVGRIADVRPFDPDGDGDQDLVLAEFGWQTTGSIRLLINDAATPDDPRFSSRVIDRRHGAIHVPVWDWNGDARDDFCGPVSYTH